METNKRVRLGTLFIPSGFSSQMEEIAARLNRDPAFVESHRDRLTPEMKAKFLEAIREFYGSDVIGIKLTFSLKAGCGMCPCSPGFTVTGIIRTTRSNRELLTPVFLGYPNRERAVFYLDKAGVLDVRTHEVDWKTDGFRRRLRKTYTQRQLMSWLPFGRRLGASVPEAEG